MLKKYAITFGIVFILAGLLGFIPAFAPNGYLFGFLLVDAVHNYFHLITGAIALYAGFTSERGSQLFFQIFGWIYGIIAILGFFYGASPLLGVMAHNWGDVWFHLIVAIIALYLGYGVRRARRVPA